MHKLRKPMTKLKYCGRIVSLKPMHSLTTSNSETNKNIYQHDNLKKLSLPIPERVLKYISENGQRPK